MAAAVFACLVPLVASADPVVAPDVVSGDPVEAKSSGGSPESARTKTFDDLSGEGFAALSLTLLKSSSGMSAEVGSLSEFDRSSSFEGDDLRKGRGDGAVRAVDGARRWWSGVAPRVLSLAAPRTATAVAEFGAPDSDAPGSGAAGEVSGAVRPPHPGASQGGPQLETKTPGRWRRGMHQRPGF